MKRLVIAMAALAAVVAGAAPVKESEAEKQAKKAARARLDEIAKQVDALKKQKKGDEAMALAREAEALAKPYPDEWVMQQRYYGLLGNACMAKKDWNGAFEAYLKESANHNPYFGANFNGLFAVIEVMREGRCDEARAMLKRVYAIDKLDPRVLPNAVDVEARTYKVDKNWSAIEQLYDRWFENTNFVAQARPQNLVKKACESLKGAGKGYSAVFAYYDKVFANRKKYGVTDKELPGLLSNYAEVAWRSMDVARMKDAQRRADAAGVTLGGMFPSLYRQYVQDLPKFPLSEEELNIPTDPSKFLGIDVDKKVVHAKDFGWNPTNATACLRAALGATNATTVVVDGMPSPWYVNAMKLDVDKCSNRRIVFAKGCTILAAPESKDKKAPNYYRHSMFQIFATNVWFEGEGVLGRDTYIGKYRNRAERMAAGWNYGGSGFWCRNVQHAVFKNLWLANNGEDGLCGGFRNSYVIDCLLDDNYRQGLSFCGGGYNVCKNVTFCNTFGGEPHCGIDFEPYYEIYSCPFQYFIDCKFYNNASKNVIFATSTYAPMTAYFKRCQFEAQRNGNVAIAARIGIYLTAECHAPSNIIFDECRIDGYSDGHANPIQFLSSMLYDVTFKNCVINDKGRFGRDGDNKCSPIALNLDRAVWDGYYPHPGIVTFENTVINGYEGVPLIEVKDRNGKYCINSFRGSVVRNGKREDLSTFDYQPPDRTHADAVEPELAKLAPAEGVAHAWKPSFDFRFDAAWYQQLPQYTMLCSGKKGETATFTVSFNAIRHAGDAIVVTRPDGKREDVYQPKPGENTFSYTFPADGVYSFNMNVAEDLGNPDAPKNGFKVLSMRGAHPAWQAGKVDLGRVVKLHLGDDYPAYTGYFEAPAAKPCTIKLMVGGLEIRNAEGKLVQRVGPRDYAGMTCIDFTAKQNEIWSFTTIGERVHLKFFAPLSGIFADEPEDLPTYGKDLAFCRQKRAGSSTVEMGKAILFPLPIGGAIAKRVEAEAAKRLAFGATNTVIKQYKKAYNHYEWMEPAMQRPADLAMMDAELASLEPLRKHRDMQKAAKRESQDLRRYVAFVSLYAPILALDDAAAKAWVKYICSEPIPNAPSSGSEQNILDEEALAEATNAAINPYGVEWLDEGVYYEDYMGIVKLAPFIADRLKNLGF